MCSCDRRFPVDQCTTTPRQLYWRNTSGPIGPSPQNNPIHTRRSKFATRGRLCRKLQTRKRTVEPDHPMKGLSLPTGGKANCNGSIASCRTTASATPNLLCTRRTQIYMARPIPNRPGNEGPCCLPPIHGRRSVLSPATLILTVAVARNDTHLVAVKLLGK